MRTPEIKKITMNNIDKLLRKHRLKHSQNQSIPFAQRILLNAMAIKQYNRFKEPQIHKPSHSGTPFLITSRWCPKTRYHVIPPLKSMRSRRPQERLRSSTGDRRIHRRCRPFLQRDDSSTHFGQRPRRLKGPTAPGLPPFLPKTGQTD